MRLYLIVGALFFAGSLQAQQEYVPSTALSVSVFDLARLEKKMDLKTIGKYTFFKPKDTVNYSYYRELAKTAISGLTGNGVDLKRKVFLFEAKDSYPYRVNAYLLPLASDKKFIQAVEGFNNKISWEESRLKKTSDKKGTYFMNSKNQVACAVFKDLAVIAESPYEYYYDEDDYLKNRAEDSIKSIIDSIRWSRRETATPVEVNPEDKEGSDEEKGEEEETETYYPEDYYDYDSDSLMIAFRQWWEGQKVVKRNKYWQQKESRFIAYMQKLYANVGSGKGLVSKNAEFARQMAVPSDLKHWVDYSFIPREMANSQLRYYSIDSAGNYNSGYDSIPYEKTPVGKFFGNLAMSGTGDFDAGRIRLEYQSLFSDSVKPFVSKVMTQGVSAELFDVIKTPDIPVMIAQHSNYSEMLGLFTKAMETSYQTRKLVMNNHPEIEKRSEQYGFAMAELLYGMVDKDLLHHTFTGEMVGAITGVTYRKYSYYTYDYDPEGNYSRIQKTGVRPIPALVLAMKVENAANLDRLMAPLLRYDFITRMRENAWVFDVPGEWGFRLNMLKKGNVLLFTNDSLYTNPDYLSRPAGLSPELVAKASSLAAYSYMNSEAAGKMLGGIADMSPIALSQTSRLTDAVKQIEATSQSADGILRTKVEIEFRNKSQNSLIELLDLADVMWK
ncbi:MAG: hypothetical protein JNL57_07365 [Bacteroidetes bacterium]|nr:hypothetical protein [Bacteroidota bacterium]